ncbi:aminoglycoside phosphotransferase family protein [Aquibacillus sp. 3ASR75-11]|uniref:Aminoglycoside phosphotransferase family protein n=1 Tax=Terrihalobacillus insolitus TaxID=2950438 RepID=A0A9X3WUY2_9BACI|nr:phosphotransferase [Terrihalobacillus insolitus]MDC3412449.1 aminoglycoside phosphotransferase family protein [Terrihalobacillus insolitus]MDC3423869.1 aminoglycoside phosphotransferase family protein [Terrihalobacillus insolitus]
MGIIIQALIVVMRVEKEVNKGGLRDGTNVGRLSSFLYTHGGLQVEQIDSIKKGVYYVKQRNGAAYILKQYKSLAIIEQQWKLFDEISTTTIVPFTSFPNQGRILYGDHYYWTLAPYVPGKSLTFSDEKDRRDAVQYLDKFHTETKGISIYSPLLKQPLYEKLEHRLQKWKRTKRIFEKYGYDHLYSELNVLYELLLDRFTKLNWNKIEQNAIDQWMWTHGDVASHNFRRDANNMIRLIDFDLLSLSPHLYDWIQLGQRFLPFLDWKLDRLEAYFSEINIPKDAWLLGIAIPSDIIREWWHFLQQNHHKKIEQYLMKLQKTWEKRKIFVDDVNSVL